MYDKARSTKLDLRTSVVPAGKQEFCVSLEFCDLIGNRPGVANGPSCHCMERSFLKLKLMEEIEKWGGAGERERCVCGGGGGTGHCLIPSIMPCPNQLPPCKPVI